MKFKFLGHFLLVATSLNALTILHVSLSTDNNPGGLGEPGDLRYCLNSMNQDLNNTPDDFEILFDFPMTIQLNGILPIINNSASPVSITIGNPGSLPTVTLDGNLGAYSGLFIPMGNVTIQNMIFQNFTARGGDGGSGTSGGGGGLGAGGAIYTPQSFLYGSYPSVTLMNVLIQNCSAAGGKGGSYLGIGATGFEGGGGGGGFGGNGGSVFTVGITGGGGGGGFGGDGGNVTLAGDSPLGGGGGGGGGLGSRATLGLLQNLGNGGSDQSAGLNGNGYGLAIVAGAGGGGYAGGSFAGGGGGGSAVGDFTYPGGGGGGSLGADGRQPLTGGGGGEVVASGGKGGDGAGAGGGAVVYLGYDNDVDGQGGPGGYAGGGGGGAGGSGFEVDYVFSGGPGGVGGGGGGGGVNLSGTASAAGGNSLGGGGGGGGGPSNGINASGGTDLGYLGGGAGGSGADSIGISYGGGGGGGGSGLGGAIFVDSNLNFTLQALSGIPTTFNTLNNVVQAGTHGTGASGATDGSDGSALGESIFLRSGSSLTFLANALDDLLTLGEGVSFTDDTSFGAGGTGVYVRGKGTVIYNGTTDYSGSIMINNACFKVNGQINDASIAVCRNLSVGPERGKLAGKGKLTGDVYVNSGAISPDTGETLTLGSLILNPANLLYDTLGSLVHIDINGSGASQVKVNGSATLAGALEIALDPSTPTGLYTLLTSSGLTGTFDQVVFTGPTPNYTLSYLPLGAPTEVQLNIIGFSDILEPPSNLQGDQKKNGFGWIYELCNQLSWSPSPSSDITGYNIYRDSVKIASVGAATLSYQDHQRKRGVSYTYAITSFNASGDESEPVVLELAP